MKIRKLICSYFEHVSLLGVGCWDRGMPISAVGLVGKVNEPLALRIFPKDKASVDALNIPMESSTDLLRFHYLVFSALDVIDEKQSAPSASRVSMYLGYLMPSEEYHVFGFISNTLIKIVVVVEEQLGIMGTAQPELQTLCRSVHQLFANHLQDPFSHIGCRIKSPRFNEELDKIVRAYNTRNQ